MKAIYLAIIALAAGGILLAAGPASAADGEVSEENPAAMALSQQVATMKSQPLNAEAARLLAKENGCFRCHSIDKPGKVGPTWSSVAERFRPLPASIQPIVQQRMLYHLLSGEQANFPDGHSERHKLIHTNPPNDPVQIKNLADFILAL
jgi:cytochrome c